jgi:sulfide:quinone oxidoreductase
MLQPVPWSCIRRRYGWRRVARADEPRARAEDAVPVSERSGNAPLRVLIAGAGVGGLETLVALRALALERVAITLLAPEPEFSLRALAIQESFGAGHPRAYPLPELAARHGARLVPERLRAVDALARRVATASGATLDYDVLVLATGARPVPAWSHGVVFDRRRDAAGIDALVARAIGGLAPRLTVIVPAGVQWTLPAYEIAFTAAAMGHRDLRVTLVTHEEEPLEIFGPPAIDVACRELQASGIHLLAGVKADVVTDNVVELASGRRLRADAIVHLPVLYPRRIPGLPADLRGFVPVDQHLRVAGTDDVYAVGDGIAAAVKHGGLAARQAEAAAHHIARRAGADVEALPYRPILQGLLRTARGPWYLRADLTGAEPPQASSRCLWWPPAKIASRWLVPDLAALDLERDEKPRITVRA